MGAEHTRSVPAPFFTPHVSRLTPHASCLTSQQRVLVAGIEAGTGLVDVGQVAVAEDLGIGMPGLERLQQVAECAPLCLGAGVVFATLAVDASLVADADGVTVVVACVGTDEVLVAGLEDRSVAGDVVVVAGEAEALAVIGDERGDGVGVVLAGGRAVDDDEVDGSHGSGGLEDTGDARLYEEGGDDEGDERADELQELADLSAVELHS